MRPFLIAIPVALLGANACKWGVVCTAEARPGIAVTIVDARTGSPVDGVVTVIATQGSYADTMSVPVLAAGARVAFLAEERAGTYRVDVQAPGYAPWVEAAVRVTGDECHVQTVHLTARLEAA